MPLVINVGLSRKASKYYRSAGTSINISTELDHALLPTGRSAAAGQ